MSEGNVTCLRVQEQTVSDDRIQIRHWSDGTKSILYLARGAAVRRGKPIFGVVSTVEIPPAFVDWISDVFALDAPTRKVTK